MLISNYCDYHLKIDSYLSHFILLSLPETVVTIWYFFNHTNWSSILLSSGLGRGIGLNGLSSLPKS